MKITIKHCGLLAAIFATGISFYSIAQEGNGIDKTAGQLEEVMVTAQRRVESAQDVAISITVFDQEQISKANMTNSYDIATYTPSLSTNTRFGPENATFSIRGFTRSLRTTASVGVYFADVIAPRGQTTQTSGDGAGPGTLFDLENVQVLKGPQGTLFGRNTTGGSILLVPVRPADELEGYFEYSAANYNGKRAQGVLNIPASNVLKFRFGIDKSERDGYLNNVTGVGEEELGNVDYTAVRISALYDISDSLENYTIISVVDSDTAGYTSRLFACNPQLGIDPISAAVSGPCNDQLEYQRTTGQDDFYDIVSTVKSPRTLIKERRLINTTTWDISSNLTLKAILAYGGLETENGSDIFGTQFTDPNDPKREYAIGVSAIYPDFPVTNQDTWVGELQFQGQSFGSRMVWQAGVYYEKSLPDGPSGNISAGSVYCDLATLESANPADYYCFDPTNGFLGSVILLQSETEYENKAIYAQSTFDLNEKFSITTGLRYTWDDTRSEALKTRYSFVGDVLQNAVLQPSNPSQSSEAPTGLVELQYRPGDSIMMYAKYIRGYRQGSVNPAADPGIDVFDEETVDTYEIGAKTSFGGWIPGRFNIALFDNDFTDMQLQTGYVSSSAAQTTAIFNAGKSEIKGLEAELFLQPFDSLRISISYSWLDTELKKQEDTKQKITDAVDAFAGAFSTPIADVGDELPFAPDESFVVSANYSLPLPVDVGDVEIGATYVYTGKQRAAASSTSPYSKLDDYELWNYNASWMGIFGSNFDLSLYLTNATDEEYVTFVSGSYNILRFESRMMGLPKMYGARLRYSF